MLNFDDSGRLYIDHECEMCEKFPLENLNEPCLNCGHSQYELMALEKYVNRANMAIDMYAPSEDEEIGVKVLEGFVQLSSIKLGKGLDEATLTDIDLTDDIRKWAEFTDHMVRVIIYPTDIRHQEEDDGEWELVDG